MSFKIAINGYGRIGRCILRSYFESTEYANLRICAINDIANIETLAHLTEFDSTHGRFLGEVSSEGGTLLVNKDVITVTNSSDIENLPWSELDIDLVMECSGTFSERLFAEKHLEAGARKVLFSQPAEKDVDATVVYGINHDLLSKREQIISNASCTTNCVVPVLKVLDDAFELEAGTITTIHSAMNDQPVIDSYHGSDLRKTRSAMQSITPVDTELAKGISRILPHLDGRLTASAIRVPTLNVSAMDISLSVKAKIDKQSVNKALKAASKTFIANVLGVSEQPLVSCDFNHDPRSAIVDLTQTRVSGKHLLRIFVWFDNEWAYANRMLDIAQLIANVDVGE